MGEIAKTVAETTGSADVVAEAEKFKDIYEQNIKNKEIKKDKVVTEGNTDNGVTQAARLSNINIANFLEKNNSEDVNFLKYVPDKMLTQKQFEKKTNYKKYSTGRSFDELAKIASQEEKQQHIDTKKNRAETWLMQLGVQFPSGQPANSSIGSISSQDGKVNIKGKKLSELGGVINKTSNQHSFGRGFDEMAAESISAEISDSAKRVAAMVAEEHLFTDEKAIERLCNTDPTLFDRIKYWISDMAAKFRGTPEERFLRDAERLYEKALATRGEITGAGVEQYDISPKMSISEIRTIQNIGKISVNNFAPQDIKNTERFAKTYWKEIGVKSPFFKNWFGDWRANDQTPIQVANKQGDATGTIKNDDTGWNIQVSGKVFNENKVHGNKKSLKAKPYIQYINDTTKKAVLLDSFGIDTNRAKSPNSLLMHSMYAVADIGNGPEVLKLYVEEMYDPNKPNTAKRDYKLLDIQNNSMNVTGSRNNVSPSTQTVVINNVADLVATVKGYDPDF